MNSKLFGVISAAVWFSTICLVPAATADDASGQTHAGTAATALDGSHGPGDSEKPVPATSSTAPVSAAAQAPDVVPGPLLQERQELFEHIQQAGEHGIGTSNYKMAFKALEDQVAAGASEVQIKSRVEELSDALKDQLKRAQILKTQRPLPPSESQQADAGAPAAPVSPAGGLAAALGNSGLLDKLKDKLGSGGLPSADVVDKLLKDPKAKDLLKNLGQ